MMNRLTPRFAAAALLLAALGSSPAHAADACAVLADHLNRGTLGELIVPFAEVIPPALQEKQPTIPLNAPAAKVDLAGEGRLVYAFVHGYMDRDRPDLVFIDTLGARVEVVADAATQAQTRRLDIIDLQVVRIDGRIYVLASDEAGPQYLTRVSKDHREVPACRITRKSTGAALAVSRSEKLCTAAMSGALTYAQFGATYSDAGREFHRNIPEVQAIPGAAQIDIDNDGTEDGVVRITKKVKPLMSRGCTWGELAVLNAQRNDIDRRRTGPLPRGGCASERLPFVFEGTAYVHSKNVPQGEHTVDEVTRLKDGRSETVCRIERKPFYEVEAAAATVSSSTAATIGGRGE